MQKVLFKSPRWVLALVFLQAAAMESVLVVKIKPTEKRLKGRLICQIEQEDVKGCLQAVFDKKPFCFQTPTSTFHFQEWQLQYLYILAKDKRLLSKNLCAPNTTFPICWWQDREITFRFFNYGDSADEMCFRFFKAANGMDVDLVKYDHKERAFDLGILEKDARAYIAMKKHLLEASSLPKSEIADRPYVPVGDKSLSAKTPTVKSLISFAKAIKRPIKSALMTSGVYALAGQPEPSYSFARAIPALASIPVWHWSYEQYRAARAAQTYSAALIHGTSGLLCGALGTLLIDRQFGSPLKNAIMNAWFAKN